VNEEIHLSDDESETENTDMKAIYELETNLKALDE